MVPLLLDPLLLVEFIDSTYWYYEIVCGSAKGWTLGLKIKRENSVPSL